MPMPDSAIALNRFGLGARPDEASPANPKAWLLDQFESYEPRPAAWASIPMTPAIAQDFAGQREALRSEQEDARKMARQELRQDSRDFYLNAVNARAAS